MLSRHQRAVTHALLTVTALLLLANALFRTPLYELGVDFVVWLQSGHSSIGRGFFQLVTTVSEPGVVMVGVAGILLGEGRRRHAFNVTIFLLLNVFLITLLKALFHDPRPFWTDPAARSLAAYCPSEFGNPSGHSWFATVSIFLLFFSYFPATRKSIALPTIACVILLVALSRMYLGAHSLNQVVLGVALGMAMVTLYYLCGLDDQIGEFLLEFNSAPKLGWKKYMLLLHALYFLAYLLAQTAIDRDTPTYELYYARAMAQCGRGHKPSEINFALFLASAVIVNFCTGFALGYERMSGCERGRKYLQGSWEINEQRYPEWLGRSLFFGIQLACLAGALAAGLAIVQLLRLEKWAVFTVLSAAAMLSGFLFTSRSCALLYRCSVICEIL